MIDESKIELLKVSVDSDKNITDFIKEDFLNKFKDEFDEVKAINLVLAVSNEDTPDDLIILGHSSIADSDKKKLTIDTNAQGISSSSDKLMKKIIDIL
ncbi:hypothetical protein MBCUT_10200 [Methanobrevibacter cuticularis]|uniref:Uncharacterized protein n=1 Tax=Methanobrevibacter cuticularis TaxID=47311 RepID=A0A166E0U3_9EURY|nr:hypothetical protein [Methanobrevibacter cuticularis]KZX16154.1 hypothetical protein MBCUT_10200 [Methanobrevibacter cuticularis]